MRAHLPSWTDAFDGQGLFVLHNTERDVPRRTYRLGAVNVVLLGRLFSRDLSENTVPPEATLDAFAVRQIINTEGQYLIERYWGQYVAFIINPQRHVSFVLRDPSGGVHCFRSQCEGVHIYFSHVADVLHTIPPAFSTNWNYILGSFLVSTIVNEKTALDQVQELLTGEFHKISKGVLTRQLAWDPRRICGENRIEDRDRAATLLRSTLQGCVNAWASVYDTIIHNLSGGLDSAIVLGCLLRTPRRPEIICLNYHTAAHEGDERPFASLAAKQAGLSLVELELPSGALSLEQLFSSMPISESPDLTAVGLPADKMQMEIARAHGAEAFFSGEGGDHIFFQMKLEHIAADYVRDRGLNRQFLNVALDTARLNKTSFWSVLRVALLHGILRRPWDPSRRYAVSPPSFLKQDAIAALPDGFVDHPWSTDLHGIGSAKALQVFLLPKVLHRHPAFGRPEVADVVHPLFSQPLVELCLRIPVYILTSGGVDRALARNAFADRIPREIRIRRSKGGTATYVSRICVDNIAFLREFILDGRLAAHEMVDRQLLDQTLSLAAIEREDNLRPILKVAFTEAWLRRWEEATRKAAA